MCNVYHYVYGRSVFNTKDLIMYTMAYKGYYINGYCDRSEARIVTPTHNIITVNTIIGAKRLITRLVNS